MVACLVVPEVEDILAKITFAHINEITAPGQMDIEKTNKYLRLFYPTYGAKK